MRERGVGVMAGVRERESRIARHGVFFNVCGEGKKMDWGNVVGIICVCVYRYTYMIGVHV